MSICILRRAFASVHSRVVLIEVLLPSREQYSRILSSRIIIPVHSSYRDTLLIRPFVCINFHTLRHESSCTKPKSTDSFHRAKIPTMSQHLQIPIDMRTENIQIFRKDQLRRGRFSLPFFGYLPTPTLSSAIFELATDTHRQDIQPSLLPSRYKPAVTKFSFHSKLCGLSLFLFFVFFLPLPRFVAPAETWI